MTDTIFKYLATLGTFKKYAWSVAKYIGNILNQVAVTFPKVNGDVSRLDELSYDAMRLAKGQSHAQGYFGFRMEPTIHVANLWR